MTVIVWIIGAVAGAMALGWLFRAGLRLALPGPRGAFARTMPVTAAFGIAVILIYLIVAIFAPLIAPFPEREIVGDKYMAWGEPFVLGTDSLGRDMLSRLIFGARNTVGIAFATTAVAFLLGTALGLWAAVTGGWADQTLSRVVDALMAIPALIFSLLLLTIFGTSVVTLVLVIAVVDATRVFRLARSVALRRGGDGLCRGRQAARRKDGLDHLQGSAAQYPAAAHHRVRPQVLLRLPHHRGAVLPRRRHPAADRRTGA